MRRGLISIGTNSTRALVAEFGDSPRVLFRRSIGTRIGEGLKEHGDLSSEAMQRTLAAVEQHAKALCEFVPSYRVIATSALRRASNREMFARRVHDITGQRLETISAEDEARCSYTGAVSLLRGDAQSFGVADLGGGSAEYAIGSRSDIDRFVSCEIGAVRLTEAIPELRGERGRVTPEAVSQAEALAARALRPIEDFAATDALVIVGGTATSLITLLRGKREVFEYATLPSEVLRELIDRLRMPLEERRQLAGIDPQRADIILGGAVALLEIYRATGHGEAHVSTNDLLLGFLLSHAG